MSSRTQKIVFLIIGLVLIFVFLYYLLNYVILPLWVNKAIPEFQKQNPPMLKIEDHKLADSFGKSWIESKPVSKDASAPSAGNSPASDPTSADPANGQPNFDNSADQSRLPVFSRGTPQEQMAAYKI